MLGQICSGVFNDSRIIDKYIRMTQADRISQCCILFEVTIIYRDII